MAIKLALQVAKEIRRGEWTPLGNGNSECCYTLEKDGIELWVANTKFFLRVYRPVEVLIPFIDRMIIWYGGGVPRIKREFRRRKVRERVKWTDVIK